MSHTALHWAWALDLKTTDKFVMVALADLADEQNSCFPGQKTLAQMVGASERTVRGSVARLTDQGYLVRAERRRKDGSRSSDRYFLQVNRQDLPVDVTGNSRPTSPADSAEFTGRSCRYIEDYPSEEPSEEPLALLSPDESGDLGTLIPDAWRPNQSHIDKAASLRLDVKQEYQRFRRHAEVNRRRQKNWNAAFTNWLRKGAEMAQQRQGVAPMVSGKPMPLDRMRSAVDAGRRVQEAIERGELVG